MSDVTLDPLEELLRESAWIRQLARRLVEPGHDADDLVQDACLAAMQHPPQHRDNLRGWLSQILRNLVRQKRRQSTRQKRREEDRHGPAVPTAPATVDLIERATTQRAVVDAVLGLAEPYRTAILLRFFEDLPPREIAARQRLPVATVRTHLTRGLERLRQRLDRQTGSRAAWIAAVLPLTQPALSAALATTVLMKSKTLIAATVAISALAITAASIEWNAAPTTPVPANASPVEHQSASVEATGTAAVEERVAADPVTTPSEPPPATPTPRRATGRTVDPEGRPLADLEVALASDTTGTNSVPAGAPHTRSDSTGAFELALEHSASGRIVASDARFRTVMHTLVRRSHVPKLALVVAAPATQFAGVVRSHDGHAIADATVAVNWPTDLLSRLSDNSDATEIEQLQVRTDADGRFVLPGARVRGAELRTHAPGFVPDRRPLPQFDERGLEIVLAAPVAKPGSVQGQVIDPNGNPVAGARVVLGDKMVETVADGGFVIDDAANDRTLSAASQGYRRGVLERPEAGWPAYVLLPLGGEPLSIRGRVVDATGRGLPDIQIWLLDATLHSRSGRPQVVEGITAGNMDVQALIDRVRSGEIDNPRQVFQRTPTSTWPFVFTDESGEFEMPGLEDRAYDLRAMNPNTLLMVDSRGVAAGSSNARITMPQDMMFDAVAGTVVGRDGQPVAGVRVRLQCDTVSIASTNLHGTTTDETTTDEAGRFRLENVPKRRVYLRVDGEPILPIEFGRGAEGGLLELSNGEPENLRIEVVRRMHMQLELQRPDLADGVSVLDAHGAPLPINVFRGRGRSTTLRLPLDGGRSPVFVVPDTAVTLVLQKGEDEVRREALLLQPGTVNKLVL
ncbi:MAG: sigma-70 family RNA polymerase sigma factor [bacterium]|nr:sigma-70 family RNA polymerase sigma factor [bacterium]